MHCQRWVSVRCRTKLRELALGVGANPILQPAARNGGPMSITSNWATDYEASKTLILAALSPLGFRVISVQKLSYGIELSAGGEPSPCISETSQRPAPIHIAFTATTRQQVDAFYRQPLGRLARTMDRREFDPDSRRLIKRLLSSPLTVTISRRSATQHRAD